MLNKHTLDRALASADWRERFPLASVSHLTAAASDHEPILLRWKRHDDRARGRRKNNFRYELMWESHSEFLPTMQHIWKNGDKASTLGEFEKKLAAVAGQLGVWGLQSFGHVRQELKKLNVELDKLRSDSHRTGPTHEEIKITERILELHHREEIMWRQRSRIMWLSAGDRNTKFFHDRASQRRRKNRITRLRKQDGQVTEDIQEMGVLISEFYKELYQSEGTENIEAVLDHVQRKVTPEMNERLVATFTVEKVKVALFQMFPTKAPEPDGFPAHFF